MGDDWTSLPPAISAAEAQQWCRGVRGPIALTGATGFVGSHLLDALRSGSRPVRLLVRDPARLPGGASRGEDVVIGDLANTEALTRFTAGAETVFHLAGLVRAPSAAAFERVNRSGTEAVVAALRRHGARARLVLVSSLAAVGPSTRQQGAAPGDEPRPVSAYGRSKLGAEEAVRAYPGEWVVLRPPAIYGPRDIDVFQFFRLAARGVVPIPSGERWVTVAHVADVVRAALSAAARGTGSTFHTGEPEPMQLRDLATRLAEAGGVRARVLGVPASLLRGAGLAGDLAQRLGFRDVAMTSDKARELVARHWSSQTASSLRGLAIEGFVPFGVGARATWAWYRQQGWLPRAKISAA